MAGGLMEEIIYGNRPKIRNSLYSPTIGAPEYPPGATDRLYAGRNAFSRAELEDIVTSGFMRDGPKAKGKKYFTLTDEPKTHLRVRSENVPVGEAVSSADVELRNKNTGEYRPIREANFAEFGYGDAPTPRVPTLVRTALRGIARAAEPVALATLPLEGAEALRDSFEGLPPNRGEAFGPISRGLQNEPRDPENAGGIESTVESMRKTVGSWADHFADAIAKLKAGG